MIGHIAKACERGRADARAGRRERWADLPWATRDHYVDGWRRERAAMRRRNELPQLELGLQTATEPGQKSLARDGAVV